MPSLNDQLKAAANYRDFLKIYVKEKKISLSQLAQQMGYSRSFTSDIVTGRRKLNLKTLIEFEKQLKISTQGKKLFRFLVALDQNDLFKDQTRASIEENIERLRHAHWGTHKQIEKVGAAAPVAATGQLMDYNDASVLAAAGEQGRVTVKADIIKKTGLLPQEVERSLQKLVQLKLVEMNDDKVTPCDTHLFLKTHNTSEMLKNIFQKSCRKAMERVELDHQQTGEFFFNSHFSIKKAALPDLKRELRQVILNYIDQSIAEDGDSIVKLNVSLFR